MTKENITTTDGLHWDSYVDKPLKEGLPAIYGHATGASAKIRNWYWVSIKRKKIASLWFRALAVSCLIIATLLQVLATIPGDVADRLLLSQISVATIVLGGLIVGADKIFGFSSGWLRYITTVTAMETLARKFELQWAGYVLERAGTLTDKDIHELFKVSAQLEEELLKLQSDETDKWVADFNSGSALLGELIKNQREASEKLLDTTTQVATAQSTSKKPGMIQLKFTYKTGQRPLSIYVDGGTAQDFTGGAWASDPVTPGLHMVTITDKGPSGTIKLGATVPAGGIDVQNVQIE